MRYHCGIVKRLFIGLLVSRYAGYVGGAVTMDVVTVGNMGNAADGLYGAVAYEFRVGTFEVTAAQYTEFLNAVAATDAYGLYSSSMWSAANGCKIQRSGSAGSYTYSVASVYADRPVNYVSWGDAARFANWLHNGQPTGAQDATTTESGAYTLSGATTDVTLMAVTRNAAAKWRIPTEHEWYKAAYHKNNGVTGNYWSYATGEDSPAPGRDVTEATNPGNNANFYAVPYPYDGIHYTTVKGEFELSGSAYGTFDQAGNVYEWMETAYDANNRVRRGGGFGSSAQTKASRYSGLPSFEQGDQGFRVAATPLLQTYSATPGLVGIGNPGNAADSTTYGAVTYEYRIGTYEVTAGKYVEFLNRVAATDTYGLYSSLMLSDSRGCKIQQNGASGSFWYTVPSGHAPRPVNFVSWGDAARFANWLHNGKPMGAQGAGTTESGSYFINGATSDAGLATVTRSAGATWHIPSENEWYKAAYHKNDGVTGNYWDYPTGSDVAPSNDMSEATSTGNNANLALTTTPIDGIYYTTRVGEFERSDSPYGTFDQAGNVYEWNEAVSGTSRGRRGQGWGGGAASAKADARFLTPPSTQQSDIGFRMAAPPPPGTVMCIR